MQNILQIARHVFICGLVVSCVFYLDGNLFAGVVQTDTMKLQVPEWWDNDVGNEPTVLPGFSPMAVDGKTIKLGAGRKYVWGNSLLPDSIIAADKLIVESMRLVLTGTDGEIELKAASTRIIESGPDHALIEVVGVPFEGLNVRTLTRVEYDGVAMVSLYLEPEKAIDIKGLDLYISVKSSPWLRMMAFDADNVRYSKKQVVFKPEYRGDFLNTIGFADGDRSFWWFADNAKGWVWNSDTVTEVIPQQDVVILRQRLVGSDWRLDQPMQIDFNYLATPVRDIGSKWRRDRVASVPTKEEAHYSKFHLWWPNAFAHTALPYTDYPKGIKEQLPPEDIRAYDGVHKNRSLMQTYRSWGMERLPYLSAHVLSPLDPALTQYRNTWEVEPPFVFPPGSDAPYTAKLRRPFLTHRSAGYSNYLLYRFDQLIDELDLAGIYFDQAGVIQSRNLENGAWVDSNGVTRSSTDIMAMRSFFKRLATLFYEKGKPGYIFAHNSGSPIVPAYTFVTSMVQGEEFNQKLKKLDYIDSVDIDTVRTQFTSQQFGIINTWLSELWHPIIRRRGMTQQQWVHTQEYNDGFRKLMAIVLLHDIPIWSVSPLETRSAIYESLDDFGFDQSEFVGYWRNKLTVQRGNNIWVSYYLHENHEKALLVAVNLGSMENTVKITKLMEHLQLSGKGPVLYREYPGKKFSAANSGEINISIPGKDFRLIEVSRKAD